MAHSPAPRLTRGALFWWSVLEVFAALAYITGIVFTAVLVFMLFVDPVWSPAAFVIGVALALIGRFVVKRCRRILDAQTREDEITRLDRVFE